ncbi:MAG: hypothetical protein WCT52_01080 [Candidatus Micrarchaeia archaeon]
MANGTRKKYTQVPTGLDHLASKQSATRLFLRNKNDTAVANKNAVVNKGYPVITKKRKNGEPAPAVYVEPSQKGIFSGVGPFVGKVVAYGMVLVSLVTFGWIGTSTTHAQNKPQTEQSGKQTKMTWGMIKSKIGETEKKTAEKTWVEKGEKKYDVEYNEGVITFKNFDGKGHNMTFSLIDDQELRDVTKKPLKMILHVNRDGYDWVCLVYDSNVIALRTATTENGEPCVVSKLMAIQDNALSVNTKSR